jgi:1-acyl-sn-glycerol-3-phosphate acyltransferase
LNPRWVRFWRPFRRLRGFWLQGLSAVELRGEHHLLEARSEGNGVLIAPNHPSHADPFVMQDASDRLRVPFYFMAAWQVFAMTHWVGRTILRQHGCFSVNREGHDMPAFRQAVRILQSDQPLVIFPEGEVLHLNDRVMPFRRGAATAALRAARRSGRPVACLPTAIKYYYATDPRPRLAALTQRLEQRLGLPTQPESPLENRIAQMMEALFEAKELECFGVRHAGSIVERRERLIAAQLSRLESRYGIADSAGTVSERVKRLRQLAIAALEGSSHIAREAAQRDLDDLFAVMQLFSYPADYLTGNPSLERLAETMDKLEEDVLEAPTARPRGIRRTVIAFGEPMLAQPHQDRKTAAIALTEALESRVQSLLDSIASQQAARPDSTALPSLFSHTNPPQPWNAAPAAA